MRAHSLALGPGHRRLVERGFSTAGGVMATKAREGRPHPVVSRPLQARFLSIPETPLCYWLGGRFFELSVGRTLGDVPGVEVYCPVED